MIPTAKRQMVGYVWITSENFLSVPWLHELKKVPAAAMKEFEENIWGLPDECLSTLDYWKDDFCAAMRGKGKDHLKIQGASHPSEAWIKTHHLQLQRKMTTALELRPQVRAEQMQREKDGEEEEKDDSSAEDEERSRKEVDLEEEEELQDDDRPSRNFMRREEEDSDDSSEEDEDAGEYGWTKKMLDAEAADEEEEEEIEEVASLASLQHLTETPADVVRCLSPRRKEPPEEQPLYSPQHQPEMTEAAAMMEVEEEEMRLGLETGSGIPELSKQVLCIC